MLDPWLVRAIRAAPTFREAADRYTPDRASPTGRGRPPGPTMFARDALIWQAVEHLKAGGLGFRAACDAAGTVLRLSPKTIESAWRNTARSNLFRQTTAERSGKVPPVDPIGGNLVRSRPALFHE